MNKTLYVKDEDGPIWEKARELAGDRLSPIVMEFLKQYVRTEEGSTRGFTRLILHYKDKGVPRAQAFVGRWLIPPVAPWTTNGVLGMSEILVQRAGVALTAASGTRLRPPPTLPQNYAVAITAKSRVVVFIFDFQDSSGEFNQGILSVYDNFEQANENAPPGLIEQAIRRRGIEVQDLDI